MNNNELMSELFGFSSPTYFRWKREKRPIIDLIEKYFLKEDLEEFIKSGQVSKYERTELSNIKIEQTNIELKETHAEVEQIKNRFNDFEELLLDNVVYQLRNKFKSITQSDPLTWFVNVGAKKILEKVLNQLKDEDSIQSVNKAKKFLIFQIESTDVSFVITGNKKQLLQLIELEFSNLECYVLINNYEKIMK